MKKRILFPVLLTIVFSLLFIFISCSYSFTTSYSCTTCHDEFRIVCPDCDGEKQSLCSQCGGDGIQPCVLCNGMGSRTCYLCSGVGSTLEYDFFSKMYVSKSCYNCVGGQVSCLMTSACSCVNGKINCNTCSAQGKIDCPDCSPETTDAQ